MRNFQFTLFAIIFFIFLGCGVDDKAQEVIEIEDVENTGNVESVEFLAYYKPGTDLVLGTEASSAKITIDNGMLSYSSFLDLVPQSGMVKNCDIKNNIMVLGCSQNGIENNGHYMGMDDASMSDLPLVAATGSNDYSYYQTETGNVTDNGYIIYSSATNDINYGDQYHPYLIRFNPADNSADLADSPTSFVLGQPEVGIDTELGLLSRAIFASPDGRYAFGSVDALGTDGGVIHWDYSILYKYDFESNTYTRLGGIDDSHVSINGMTSNRRYIVYTSGGQTKILDLVTDDITITDINTINVKKNAWGDNGPCVGTSNGDLYYKNFANNSEHIVCSASGSGWIYNTMFSENGEKIYFLLEGNGTNYLCVTDGLGAGSSYETISPISLEIEDMILIK